MRERKFVDLEVRTGLQLFAEMFGAIFLQLLAGIFLREPWLHLAPGSTLHTLAVLAPIVPVWLILLAMVRHYFRIDEYQRLLYLQAISLTAGIMAGFNWSYPYASAALALRPLANSWSSHFALVFVVVSVLLNRNRAARATDA